MSPDLVLQIFTTLASLVIGGGFVRLLTVRAERNKILGEGEVSQANAAKTYHEISMELLAEAREQAKGFKNDIAAMQAQMDGLQRKVQELSDLLEEKDREIIERDRRITELQRR